MEILAERLREYHTTLYYDYDYCQGLMLTVPPPLASMLLLREHLALLMELVMMLESVPLLVTRVLRSVLELCPTVGVQDRETQVSGAVIILTISHCLGFRLSQQWSVLL